MQINDRSLRDHVEKHMYKSIEVKKLIAECCTNSILSASRMIVETYQSGGKVLLCGNGGSAADCQHMAAEFVNLLSVDFERPGLPAIA